MNDVQNNPNIEAVALTSRDRQCIGLNRPSHQMLQAIHQFVSLDEAVCESRYQ
jgi:hypothetical protein